MTVERPLGFSCRGDLLLGILHEPAQPNGIGVIVIVGGPQYRVGSHRQFVLMARVLAERGFAVLRFDYRGMGDSGGETRSFLGLNDDIDAAVSTMLTEVPAVRAVVLWGLCDGASAALLYGHTDRRVAGLVLANPWVRTGAGEARAYVRHYYLQRVMQKSFWRKVAKGQFGPARALRQFVATAWRALRPAEGTSATGDRDFVADMLRALVRFTGPRLLLASGRDLVAKEFLDLCGSDAKWRAAIADSRTQMVRLDGADHTFSDRAALRDACEATAAWLAQPSLEQPGAAPGARSTRGP